MAEKYEMVEKMGQGRFSSIWKARNKETGMLVAIKRIDLENEEDIEVIHKEMSLMKNFGKQENITKYHGSYIVGHEAWLVLELLEGSLRDMMIVDERTTKPIEEKYVAIIMHQALKGLQFLHSSGVIHRDLKAANILLSKEALVKLADFGVSAKINSVSEKRHTFVGTSYWMAPEVITEGGHDYKADIWSLGITAVELAKGNPPFSKLKPNEVISKVTLGSLSSFIEGSGFSRVFREFLGKCLQRYPKDRPTAAQLLSSDQFIKKGRKSSPGMLSILLERKLRWASLIQESKNEVESEQQLLGDSDDDYDSDTEERSWDFDTMRLDPMAAEKLRDKINRYDEGIDEKDAQSDEENSNVFVRGSFPRKHDDQATTSSPRAFVPKYNSPAHSFYQPMHTSLFYPILNPVLSQLSVQKSGTADIVKDIKADFQSAEAISPDFTYHFVDNIIFELLKLHEKALTDVDVAAVKLPVVPTVKSSDIVFKRGSTGESLPLQYLKNRWKQKHPELYKDSSES